MLASYWSILATLASDWSILVILTSDWFPQGAGAPGEQPDLAAQVHGAPGQSDQDRSESKSIYRGKWQEGPGKTSVISH